MNHVWRRSRERLLTETDRLSDALEMCQEFRRNVVDTNHCLRAELTKLRASHIHLVSLLREWLDLREHYCSKHQLLNFEKFRDEFTPFEEKMRAALETAKEV